MVSIDSLDDDVWILITGYLRHSSSRSSSPLPRNIALASVSRRLRHLCLSTCIKKVSWRWSNPCPRIPLFPPPSVGLYIRELDFVITQTHIKTLWFYGCHSLYHAEECTKITSELMNTTASSLCVLHTLRIKIEDKKYTPKRLLMGPWRTLIEAVFLLPALESLELEAPWFAEGEPFPLLTLRHTNLRCLIYRAPFACSLEAVRTPEYGRRTAEQMTVETHNLRLLLDANRNALEVLQLPAELADSLLDAPFPSLTELSFSGYEPVYHTWVRALPPRCNLRKLHIETVSDTSPILIPVTSHLTNSHLTNIRSLKPPNPRPDNRLFDMLPPSIEHLSLVPYLVPFMLSWLLESAIPA